jgi:predicted nucleic acid-binding protein
LLECQLVSSLPLFPDHELLAPAETEVISMAVQQKLPLLIEERLGRKIAVDMGLHISGIAGQIIKAQRSSLIPAKDALVMLDQLKQHGRIPKKLHQGLSKAVAEIG